MHGATRTMQHLNENPRLGLTRNNSALHPGHSVCQSTAALGVSWSVASGTRQSEVMGRFMSPDWASEPEAVPYANLSNPQSLNLYGYVGNNPLSRVDKDGHCCYDYVAGTVGGILNIVPNTVNLINDVTNAAISPFTSFRFDHLDTIQPDANASATGIATGEALQMVVPIGDVGKGGQLFEDAAKIETGLTAGTDRAAQREAMRQEGIPTSQQPVSQEMTAAGRQYTYETPEGTKLVQRNTSTDSSHPGQPHVEAGAPKPGGQTDSIGRPRLQNDKTKVNVTPDEQ
jgi:hypothetical protein